MRYTLFLLLTATLFIRPAEIFPWARLPYYEFFILSCTLASIPKLREQLTSHSLAQNSVTACLVGFLLVSVITNALHFSSWGVRVLSFELFKPFLYYLLLVGCLDSDRRVISFVRWLVLLIALVAVLGLLNWYGLIELLQQHAIEDVRRDAATGEACVTLRLISTGIFSDPNDLAMILAVGVCITIGQIAHTTSHGYRAAYLMLLCALVFSLYLTQSRGGFLALLAGLFTLSVCRWGFRRSVWCAALGLPVIFILFSGRITNIGDALEADTGQGRIQIWADAFGVFCRQPLLGIGQGALPDEIGYVAHNSFLHSFVELGFVGGVCFLGAFVVSMGALIELCKHRCANRSASPLAPSVLAAVIASMVAMLSISRAYVTPTFLVLGIAASCVNAARPGVAPQIVSSNYLLWRRLCLISIAFLGLIYCVVRVGVHRT